MVVEDSVVVFVGVPEGLLGSDSRFSVLSGSAKKPDKRERERQSVRPSPGLRLLPKPKEPKA
eukprot:5535455-Lingulodinium_polyedra.AAC.1